MGKAGKAAAVFGGAVAIATVSGVAYGAIAATQPTPGSGGTYTGCYETRTGAVRLLTNAAPACTSKELPAAWDQGGQKAVTLGIDSFGNLAGGNARGTATVTHSATGKYIVNFPAATLGGHHSNECASTATLSLGMSGLYNSAFADAPAGEISTLPAFDALTNPYQIVVNTYDSTGTAKDSSFWLTLNC